MKDFIEQQIIDAVKKLLTVRVNEIMQNWELLIPVIEFGKFSSDYATAPIISLTSFEKALGENITLDGLVDRAVITGKKYNQPKVSNCGQDWELIISLRITLEDT